MEEWRPVKGFETQYHISSIGRLKRLAYTTPKGKHLGERICSVKNSKGWYLTIILGDKFHHKTCRIHRLVYEAFVGTIPNGFDVHHKDGNKQNNDVNNLELLPEHEHHVLHSNNPNSYRDMNFHNIFERKWVTAFRMDGTFFASFPNAKIASLATGVCARNILQVADKTEYSPGHVRKQAGGFIWKYNDET